jgi:hypothetical protein
MCEIRWANIFIMTVLNPMQWLEDKSYAMVTEDKSKWIYYASLFPDGNDHFIQITYKV